MGSYCIENDGARRAELAYIHQNNQEQKYAELMRAADELAAHVEAVSEWMRSNGYDDDADQAALTAYQQAKDKTK